VGARTGRDGIHGATFASEELSEETEASRPQVQVGDPFTEKLLLEASLELIKSGHIVGIQDMGAAGLASASSEMAARAGTGVDIDVAKMPVREPDMTPYEILLSESQERMLVVAQAGHEDEVVKILEKWELEAAVIGHVTDDGHYRVREGDRVVAEIPGPALVECPTYTRDGEEPEEVRRLREWDPAEIDDDAVAPLDALRTLLASPNIASKAWVHDQYDSTVRTNTVQPPGGDAGVLRVRGTKRGIAATVDCNPRYVYLDPRKGGKIAVAEAGRNLVCVGARPRAVTDNLNFGNPHKPAVYFQMRESVLGMAEACERLETPVTGGNVSLYNENPAGAIFPTPVIGMVGVLDDVSKAIGAGFRSEGDAIVLLGRNTAEIGASEYLKAVHGKTAGAVPDVDLGAEKALHEAVLALVAEGLLASAHHCAEGGLAVALAESAIGAAGGPAGARVELGDDLPVPALLFGEAQGRIVVSCPESAVPEVLARAEAHGVPAARIGTVGARGGELVVERPSSGVVLRDDIDALAEVYTTAIPAIMDAPATSGG
jgi:phosphoribosylformylglycinamidine synthase II